MLLVVLGVALCLTVQVAIHAYRSHSISFCAIFAPQSQRDAAAIQAIKDVVIHEVEQGQDLKLLSMLYDVDIKTLKAVNGLKTTTLAPGQKLKIPMSKARAPNKPSEATR